jgi:hypothetical protein
LTVANLFEFRREEDYAHEQASKLEHELLDKFRAAFIQKWGDCKRNYATDLRIEKIDESLTTHWDRELDVPAVNIQFVDYYDVPNGEVFDNNRVPISHINSGDFDDDDLTTNEMRKEKHELQAEEQKERKEYERLKRKFE